MRILQNFGLYPSYRPRLAQLRSGVQTFEEATTVFLNDRFGGSHVLQPVQQRDPSAFFANGDDEFGQRLWAKENGLPTTVSLEDILRSQIEHHRTEVFYNQDPMRYGDAFLQTLPGCVRRTIAWRAAPSAGGRFLKHDIILANYPSLLEHYKAQGARAVYFSPAHDPVMDEYAVREDRPIDVLFVGTFSRHHRIRASMLEAIARMRATQNIALHLDISKYTRLADSPLGLIGPLRKDRRSRDIRAVARPPIFGRDLLAALSSAKIVVNGKVDMSGEDRGNMRIWEAMGCRAALVSDAGRYPAPFEDGRNFVSYESESELLAKISELLEDDTRRTAIANAGFETVSTKYSKTLQWQDFEKIAT
ncbi:MAG: glycosyltransferase [Sphingomonas sp.]|nr:glycosyltransferase [Sphingomonas sp.]